MTAGKLGENFEKAVNEENDLAPPLTSRLKEAARAILEFVDERNQLVHAHVYSEPDGRQQLIYLGKDKTRTWSVAEIDDLAHRFESSRSHEGNLESLILNGQSDRSSGRAVDFVVKIWVYTATPGYRKEGSRFGGK